jgi:hypothetical protein
MARTNIALTSLGFAGKSAVAWTAADATNDHSFVNDGKTLLLVKNATGAAAINVDVDSVADENGRLGDVQLAVANGEIGVFGPFKPSIFNQSGLVNVNLDVDTTSFVAAVKMTF